MVSETTVRNQDGQHHHHDVRHPRLVMHERRGEILEGRTVVVRRLHLSGGCLATPGLSDQPIRVVVPYPPGVDGMCG
jgi:hypothetical protein